jgi:hypothetical protein
LRAATVAVVMGLGTAQAAEVQVEGSYRARARLFDSLSIDSDVVNAEGVSAYGEHRLWLRPRFILNENVGLFADIKGLDNQRWGTDALQWVDPTTGEAIELAWTDEVAAPAANDDGRVPDLTLWRVWGQVDTDVGRFTFGRVPLHWGSGLWLNDGLGPQGEYGDTADRVAYEHEISDVFIQAAIDVSAEGLVNEGDDTTSYNLAAAYRGERAKAGLYLQLRHIPTSTANGSDFTLFTVDGSTEAELGVVTLEAEAIGQFGGGDLTADLNDVQVTAIAAMIRLGYDSASIGLSLEGGMATGDGDRSDAKLKTFTFDRDYNIALLMFEQAMPIVAAAQANETNGGRSAETALTGNAVSNVMYLRPSVSREIIADKLDVEAAFIAAIPAKLPSTAQFADRSSYGMEIDATVRYRAFDHLEVGGTLGLFLPGSFYKEYSDPEEVYVDGFSGTVFGGQITGAIRF